MYIHFSYERRSCQINIIRRRRWLEINEKMQNLSPKEYYKEMFKKLVQEINDNIEASEKISKL